MKKVTFPSPSSVTESMLKHLVDQDKATVTKQMDKPTTGVKPVEPAAEYQDNGGGYNSDFTIPQE